MGWDGNAPGGKRPTVRFHGHVVEVRRPREPDVLRPVCGEATPVAGGGTVCQATFSSPGPCPVVSWNAR